MAAPGPGAGAASGGAGCGGAGASAGSGSSGAGGRLPSRVLELVFSYLELSELRSCALVCKHWYRCLHGDENSEVWRSLCARSLAEEALRTDILCNLPSYKAKVRGSRATSKPGSYPARRSRGLPSKLESCFTSSSRLSTASASQYLSHTSSPQRSFLWIEVLLRNPPHF
ncbi:F-box/SPRY domain-containing protein 1 [Peromyscus eremicus]|uniref:F-box/SPRY domain-containing protein 1 n=1 Tax=Peromyscus eremicus TaxID=42410 RepID=UPI0027DCF4A6|nr:F-box/SPRY domain-containing protein 1 [Peromyscus eremicus]